MCIGERIKKRRTKLNLTQAALAELVGIAQQSLQSIESGKIEKPRKIKELLRLFKQLQSIYNLELAKWITRLWSPVPVTTYR
ncbi:MAG: helix-turn-helix domain-containing protein [Shewanella xiamenensis]|nr:helix-turn-helix domain-containing protein [Shewanella xiamenensis]